MTTVTQGSVGLGVAISYFVCKGLTVCLPLNDNQPYDLVVDDGGLKRISAKTTRFKDRGQSVYTVQLKSVRHNKTRNKIYKFDGTVVDQLFVYTASGDKYLIPADVVNGKNSLSLGKHMDQYRV